MRQSSAAASAPRTRAERGAAALGAAAAAELASRPSGVAPEWLITCADWVAVGCEGDHVAPEALVRRYLGG